jgi:hypothetical protein
MRIDKLIVEAEKIVPFRKILPYFLALFIAATIFGFLNLIIKLLPNKEYYLTEVIGKVQKIEEKDNNVYFFIGSKVFLIKDEVLVHLSVGDSLVKHSESYQIIVYNSRNEIKVVKENKRIILREII